MLGSSPVPGLRCLAGNTWCVLDSTLLWTRVVGRIHLTLRGGTCSSKPSWFPPNFASILHHGYTWPDLLSFSSLCSAGSNLRSRINAVLLEAPVCWETEWCSRRIRLTLRGGRYSARSLCRKSEGDPTKLWIIQSFSTPPWTDPSLFILQRTLHCICPMLVPHLQSVELFICPAASLMHSITLNFASFRIRPLSPFGFFTCSCLPANVFRMISTNHKCAVATGHKLFFLAVQNSSIGDLVTDSLTHWLTHSLRVDIWRDRCDRRSCKILVSRVNFSENNANCFVILPKNNVIVLVFVTIDACFCCLLTCCVMFQNHYTDCVIFG